MFTDYIESPIGTIEIKATEQGVCSLVFIEDRKPQATPNEITQQCQQQLDEYFKKKRRQFDLPLTPKGTPFQQTVWQKLQSIPLGQTITYQQLAKTINKPKAMRAVGAANGRNPISIIIPCHRMIGSNGSLTGYAGGLERKAWLLKHEQTFKE